MTKNKEALEWIENEHNLFGLSKNVYEKIRAALTNAPEWQPIETADGCTQVPVLIFNSHDGIDYIRQAKMINGKWYEVGDDPDTDGCIFKPTHWMPLPQPPKMKE